MITGIKIDLKMFGMNVSEFAVIPEFKRRSIMFFTIVFTIQLFQSLSLILVSFKFPHFYYVGFTLVPILFFSANILYFNFMRYRFLIRAIIICFTSIIALTVSVFFLFYYFKEEIIIWNYGIPFSGSTSDAFAQLNELILSEKAYLFFSVAILLFFQIIYLIPFLIFDNKFIESINLLKTINEELRGKK